MTKRIKNILKGAGSILDIYPASDYSRIISNKTDAEKLEGDWKRIGSDFYKGIQKVADEQGKQK